MNATHSNKHYVIGVDIGTGSTKAVAVNRQGVSFYDAQFYYQTVSRQAGYSEIDPDLIWDAFKRCIEKVVKTVGILPEAICLSSAMHSIIPVNKEGQTLGDMLTWADTRSAVIAEELRNSAKGNTLYAATGTPVHSMSPLSKVIWFRKHQPRLFADTYKFISIKEYIWHKLFGTYEVDYSIASATGLFDIDELKWNATALETGGITAEELSEPVPTTYNRQGLNEGLAKELQLSTKTIFMIGASDGCMANLGSFAIEKGVAALTIGTSGAVRVGSRIPIRNFESMLFNYRLDEQTFISGGPINNGGNVVQWLLKKFLNIKNPDDSSFNELFSAIETIPAGSDLLIFLPYLHGERAPVWDAKSCGSFFGIKAHHTQAHFLRAAVEGICFALADVLKSLELSATINQLNVSGGFTKSKLWIQMLADITGKRICLNQTEDASAVGAAYLAMKHLGMIHTYDEIKPTDIEITEPNKEHHLLYQQSLSIYQKLYRQLKDIMHQLYDFPQQEL